MNVNVVIILKTKRKREAAHQGYTQEFNMDAVSVFIKQQNIMILKGIRNRLECSWIYLYQSPLYLCEL